ncbi:Palmitoyltransferase [Hexamita inflata]|uniref:Palmitoyltransferase n=1 Tax=Hexamita inflata TaxID=28002 RepID=A0AA86PAP2_9EUKA|nr:Palmitoyltransferase [Hexamita inflata]CAI9942524.1 Palmitoyltransferase [Hexamita inflata]
MLTICQSAPEISKNKQIFNGIITIIPKQLRLHFLNFLKAYGQGKSFMFMVFIFSVCFGSYLIIKKYQKAIFIIPSLQINKNILIASKIEFQQRQFIILYIWQILSYLWAFLVKSHTKKEFESDPILNLPKRQKQCKACSHTVTKFDHHCIWISNCVAGGNQIQFIFFLLSTIIINSTHGVLCARFLIKAYSAPLVGYGSVQKAFGLKKGLKILFNSFTPVFAQVFMFAIISLALVPFCIGQILNVLQNKTTFERLKNQRLCLEILEGKKVLVDYKEIKDSKDATDGTVIEKVTAAKWLQKRNIYDQGWAKNIKEALEMALARK